MPRPIRPSDVPVTSDLSPAPAAKAPSAPASPDRDRVSGWAPRRTTGSNPARAGSEATLPAQAPGTALLDTEISKLNAAMRGLGTNEQAVFDVLEKNPPPVVKDLAVRYQQTNGRPLRQAINSEFEGAEARRALGALDASRAIPGDTGGVQASANKVLELAKIGAATDSDQVNHYGVTTNNKIDLMVQGKNAFPELFKAIDGAKDSINVSYYIVDNDKLGNEFADKLIAAKNRGVEVRLMVDGIGSQQMVPNSGSRQLMDRLEKGGVQVIRNHVVDVTRKDEKLNHPDHRKIVVVDGKTGFTGGMNIGEPYIDQYHDLMVKAEGDVVKQMQSEWMTEWVHLGGKLPVQDEQKFMDRFFPKLPQDGAGAPGAQAIKVSQHIPGEHQEIMKQSYLEHIAKAEKSIYIENPYCTNPEIQTALIAAAKRGVDVHVVLPGESDHGFSHMAARQRYPEMIKAGVHLYEYPGFNHGKVMVTDEKFTTIGSSNLDDVALFHVYEMNLDVSDPKFAQENLQNIFQADIPKSKPMKAEDISRLQILTGKFWNLFSHAI